MNNRLIVGLGNIGNSYDFTRHNVGFLFLDKIIEHFEVTDNFQKSQYSMVVNKKIDNVNVYFIKPTTYMNNSGLAVSYWKNWLKIDLPSTKIDRLVLPGGIDVDNFRFVIETLQHYDVSVHFHANYVKNIEELISDSSINISVI